jgi:hypothetical protein
MTDDLGPDDEIDLAASDVVDGAPPDRPTDERSPELARRVAQFEATRRALRDDHDAPSAGVLDHLVATALAAGGGQGSGVGPPAAISSLSHRRARRSRGVLAAAASVVLLAGAGWFLTREQPGQEASEEASTGLESDAEASADSSGADAAEPVPSTTARASEVPSSPVEGGSVQQPPGAEDPEDSAAGTAAGETTIAPAPVRPPIWVLLLEWMPGDGDGRSG